MKINANPFLILLVREDLTPEEVERRIKVACDALDTNEDGEDWLPEAPDDMDYPYPPVNDVDFMQGETFLQLRPRFLPPEGPLPFH